MIRFMRNKNELLVLTGSIYSFVAYLTAFSLEVLFLVDLARQNQANEQQLVATSVRPQDDPGGPVGAKDDASIFNARLNFEAMHAHITISCLAVAILYFVVFITSLLLIVALILRSTFMLLIWMCAMTTLYLPEFGLVVYVSVYSWGIDTRNGQTEMVFYLFRAILNVIFIIRTHKLLKQWNYEKDFYRLKSGISGLSTISGLGSTPRGATTSGRPFGTYDSPFFVGDSLTTTINPVFSSSTLNLDRYNHVRDLHARDSPTNNSASGSVFSSSDYVSDYNNTTSTSNHQQQKQFPTIRTTKNHLGLQQELNANYQRESGPGLRVSPSGGHQTSNRRPQLHAMDLSNLKSSYHPTSRFYLGNAEPNRFSFAGLKIEPTFATGNRVMQFNNTSMLSINDDFPDYEMDLDYRTLGQRNYYMTTDCRSSGQSQNKTPSRSLNDQSYSTQSLDRRQLKEFGLTTEQVVLRPLGHQPFDYLHRPGSTTNLNKLDSLKRDLY